MTTIKTNLDARGHARSTEYHGIKDGYAVFTCGCGNEFRLRSTNQYVSDAQYRCLDCKRVGRITPFVGERHIYKRIRSDAKTAGRVFEIGFDWFVKKCHERCNYCGRSDGNSSTVPSKSPGKVLLQDFRYNGLDRIDNSIGYVEQNCVPCCIICNRAKNSMPYCDFIEWLHDVATYRKD